MEAFKKIISQLGLILKPYNFKLKGSTFYLFKDDNWGLVEFQKSKSSTSESVTFTINLGTCSNLLRKIKERDLKVKPIIAECDWKKRIGFLLPAKNDHWWTIDKNTNLTKLTEEISSIIKDQIIPEIMNYIRDEQLEKHWRTGNSEGLTEYQRIENLTLILKEKNSKDLPSIVSIIREEVKGKPLERSVSIHFKELGI